MTLPRNRTVGRGNFLWFRRRRQSHAFEQEVIADDHGQGHDQEHDDAFFHGAYVLDGSEEVVATSVTVLGQTRRGGRDDISEGATLPAWYP